ncbi:MAG: serine/threonine protein phosphatase [Synechococcus sp. TMED19]|nr:MAG: serine/threonine protein phosphatase [Synechococcus sp. TMED19]
MGGTPPAHRSSPPEAITPAASLRQLIDSLNREQRRNQELLASLGFALRSFTNLSRFLELVPLLTARLVEAEGAVLLTFRSDGGLWREQLHGSTHERCGKLLRLLAGLQDSELDRDAGDEAMASRLDQLVRRQLGDVQLFGTSVVAKNRQRGRLYVFSGDPQFSWSEVRRRHVQLVADQTAVAIENELLLEEMRRHQRLDQQLSIGGEIQAQLLPSRCPVIDGVELAASCRPAFQVGGDYYDFIPTRPQLSGKRREQGRWAVVMGDVMGKGIPAGLLMTLLRGMLRAEVLTGLPPDRILHDLNELAQEDLAHSNRFVTLFYSEFDPRTRVLRFSNAAHNPPLIWRRQGHTVERLDAPGLLIGLQPDADYGCEQVQLEPGDVLLYYTDGVTEASGVGGERFDEERLMRALLAICKSVPDAQGILDQLFARLDRFVGAGRHLEDDASMVVLKVHDEVVLPAI